MPKPLSFAHVFRQIRDAAEVIFWLESAKEKGGLLARHPKPMLHRHAPAGREPYNDQ
jgi:hypothetical protein